MRSSSATRPPASTRTRRRTPVTETQENERPPAADIAAAIGDALVQATETTGTSRTEDRAEVRAITEATCLALVRSQDHRPKIADGLQAGNDRLRQKLADLRAEHTRLKDQVATFARVIHVLEVENAQLRAQSQAGDVIRPLQRQTH